MPTDTFPHGDPFHSLEGKDGFHVVQVETGPILILSVLAYGGGMPFNVMSGDTEDGSVELLDLFDPSPRQRGEVDRLRLVMDSVCRYFTTGGNWKELNKALDDAKKVIVGGIEFPGYYLSTSYGTTDGDFQHVFVQEGTTKAVLWNEPEVGDSGLPVGGWIEPTTLEAIKEQQANDDHVWNARGRQEQPQQQEEKTDASGARDSLHLSIEQGVRASGAAEVSGGPGVSEEDAAG